MKSKYVTIPLNERDMKEVKVCAAKLGMTPGQFVEKAILERTKEKGLGLVARQATTPLFFLNSIALKVDFEY